MELNSEQERHKDAFDLILEKAKSTQPSPVECSNGKLAREILRAHESDVREEFESLACKEMSRAFETFVEILDVRDKLGEEKYGTRLRTPNGRCTVKDMLDEISDLAMYTACAVEEDEITPHEIAVVLVGISLVENMLRKITENRKGEIDEL